ncbi:hypothetical protein ABTX80_24970 [Streptomyces erythrochromogenes]|uniref:hypothetical protein n=1 Tax=Streptomyces erythrochromogenes TaxID=285574 RepID=UPI003326C574
MSAYDWASLLAVGALVTAFLCYIHADNDRREWAQSTGRNPQTVADGVAEHRRDREIERLEAWLALPDQPIDIPTQRQHRTEDPK